MSCSGAKDEGAAWNGSVPGPAVETVRTTARALYDVGPQPLRLLPSAVYRASIRHYYFHTNAYHHHHLYAQYNEALNINTSIEHH